MGNFSSKSRKKKQAVNNVDMAMLSLKTQRKKLADQQKLLELRIQRHTEVARELVAEHKKDRALLVLKKKKLTEKQLQDLGNLQFSIETMISDVEMSKHQNKLHDVLLQGNNALKQLQQEVTVDDVRKLMDDTAEAKALQDEMSDLLSNSLTGDETVAVDAELAALEAEAMAAEVAAMPRVPSSQGQGQDQGQGQGQDQGQDLGQVEVLPSVPKTKVQAKQEETEEEPQQAAPLMAS
ncbi:Snf7-domain-containing protein [Haematococcus lacustris]